MAVYGCTKDRDLVFMVDLMQALVNKRMMEHTMVHVEEKIKYEYAKEILSYELKYGWNALNTKVMIYRHSGEIVGETGKGCYNQNIH